MPKKKAKKPLVKKRACSSGPPYGVEKSFCGVPKALEREKEDSEFHDLLYEKCDDESARARIGEFVFDPIRWKKEWKRATDPKNFHMPSVRGLRKIAQIGTLQAICSHQYFLPNGKVVPLSHFLMEKASRSTRKYTHRDIEGFIRKKNLKRSRNNYSSKVMVVRGDCLESAEWLIRQKHLNPAVLNMANGRKPGGAWLNAAGAQEENIHRRTSLAHCLGDPYKIDTQRSWKYPIPEFGSLYTPNALYFRGSEVNCYRFLESPLQMSFVSVAAYARPPLKEEDGELKIAFEKAEKTKKKIRSMLATAEMNGHDALVLSAFGCGAFKNPPKHMAQLFKSIIDKQFSTSFKCIIFAIIDDHNSKKSHNKCGNVIPFSEVFNTEPIDVGKLPFAANEGIAKNDAKFLPKNKKMKKSSLLGERKIKYQIHCKHLSPSSYSNTHSKPLNSSSKQLNSSSKSSSSSSEPSSSSSKSFTTDNNSFQRLKIHNQPNVPSSKSHNCPYKKRNSTDGGTSQLQRKLPKRVAKSSEPSNTNLRNTSEKTKAFSKKKKRNLLIVQSDEKHVAKKKAKLRAKIIESSDELDSSSSSSDSEDGDTPLVDLK